MRSIETQEIPFKKKKKLFFLLWRWSNTGTGCPENLWILHPWRCSKSNRAQSPLQVCLIDPPLSRWVGLSNLQRSLTTSAVLRVSDSMKPDSSLPMLKYPTRVWTTVFKTTAVEHLVILQIVAALTRKTDRRPNSKEKETFCWDSWCWP